MVCHQQWCYTMLITINERDVLQQEMQVGKSGQTHAILDEYKLDYLPHSKLGSKLR
jgi:hypothetical protein